ncbi:MAG: hypothetical protein FWD61_18615 [Phycisphaerales bacterium]|nr:hypothetical protein [Phycisphaerales bacterium]
MRILFDHGTPAPLRREVFGHDIHTAYEMGWASLNNGELLKAAETTFDALVTTDKNLRYQQNLAGRRLAILVLPTTSWPRIQQHISKVNEAIHQLKAGDFRELGVAIFYGKSGRSEPRP